MLFTQKSVFDSQQNNASYLELSFFVLQVRCKEEKKNRVKLTYLWL